jgi:hypothetical protein
MMPQIVEYEAPQGIGLRPSETGIEATAGAARRVQGAYTETAALLKQTGEEIGSGVRAAGQEAVAWETRREISMGSAAQAGILNRKTQEWKETNQRADPRDPTVAQKFNAGVEKELQDWKGTFYTQEGQDWAERRVEMLRNHFAQMSAGDRATAAGQARVIAANQTVNGAANSAFWAGGTPGAMRTAFDTLNNSGLPAKAIEEGKAEAVKRGALGSIDQKGVLPDWIKEKDYSKYVDDDMLKQLMAAKHQKETQAKAANTAQDKLTADAQDKAVADAHTKNRDENVSFDPVTNTYTFKPEYFVEADKTRHMPRGDAQGESDFEWGRKMQAESRKEAATHDKQDVVDDFLKRATTGNNPPTASQVDLAEQQHDITHKTATNLRRLINDKNRETLRDPNLVATMGEAQKLIGTDAIGVAKFNEFRQQFLQQYLDQKANGTLPPNALSLEDKNSLLRQNLDGFMRNRVQRIIDSKTHATPFEPGTPNAPRPAPTVGPHPVVPGTPAPLPFVPPATWQWSPSRRQYRDPATDKRYDPQGKEIKT